MSNPDNEAAILRRIVTDQKLYIEQLEKRLLDAKDAHIATMEKVIANNREQLAWMRDWFDLEMPDLEMPETLQ